MSLVTTTAQGAKRKIMVIKITNELRDISPLRVMFGSIQCFWKERIKRDFVDSVTLYSREIVGGVTRTLSPSPNGGLFPQHYSSMLGA